MQLQIVHQAHLAPKIIIYLGVSFTNRKIFLITITHISYFEEKFSQNRRTKLGPELESKFNIQTLNGLERHQKDNRT